MPIANVADAALIDPVWGNAVADQINLNTPAIATLTSGNRRMGANVRRVTTGQTIANATFTTITFDTEDNDTDSLIVAPATTLTIPSTGIWVGVGAVYYPVAALGVNYCRITAGGFIYEGYGGTGSGNQSVAFAALLANAATVTLATLHNQGAAQNVTARLELWRVSI